jgi:hypothetical protein
VRSLTFVFLAQLAQFLATVFLWQDVGNLRRTLESALERPLKYIRGGRK